MLGYMDFRDMHCQREHMLCYAHSSSTSPHYHHTHTDPLYSIGQDTDKQLDVLSVSL